MATLEALAGLPGNNQCADCSVEGPKWAAVTLGVVVCDACCSVHRSLGRSVSEVLPLAEDVWDPSLLSAFCQLGNTAVKSIWEARLDQSAAFAGGLAPSSTLSEKAKFLKEKYGKRKFLSQTSSPSVNSLCHAVMTNDVLRCFEQLVLGVNPNDLQLDSGRSALHFACAAGSRAVIELLLLHGADVWLLDSRGHTPLEEASASGFLDLAVRLRLHAAKVERCLQSYLTNTPRARDGESAVDPSVSSDARQALRRLPDGELEDLTMDAYDEICRREAEEIYERFSTCPLENRIMVPFLPVTDDFPAPRQQARQKLATLTPARLAALVDDILRENRERQRRSHGGSVRHLSVRQPTRAQFEALVAQVADLSSTVSALQQYNATFAEQIAQVLAENQLLRQELRSQRSMIVALGGSSQRSSATPSHQALEEEAAPASAPQASIPEPRAHTEEHNPNLQVELAAKTDVVVAAVEQLFAAVKAGRPDRYYALAASLSDAIDAFTAAFDSSPHQLNEALDSLRAQTAKLVGIAAEAPDDPKPMIQAAFEVGTTTKAIVSLTDSWV